ncbi:MAG: SDR family NAD(P)-dependent oxidoreductase [Candidatus Hodarchaeota archaeon]
MRIFITGANRGLGLEFVNQYLERGEEIIATCRRPKEAISLQKSIEQVRESLTLVQLDVSFYNSIDNAFKTITQQFPSLDMLINNAGIISGGQNRYHVFGKLYTENIAKIILVNAIRPVLVIEKFFPLLKKGKNAKVVNILSRRGEYYLECRF